MDAWNWVTKEIRGEIGGGEWLHAESLDSFADIFSNAFTLIGNCRFPLYTTADKAQEWFDSWMLINEQRVARRG